MRAIKCGQSDRPRLAIHCGKFRSQRREPRFVQDAQKYALLQTLTITIGTALHQCSFAIVADIISQPIST